MLNQIVLVGRIKEFLKLDDDCRIKIAVQRHYKNKDGEYDVDLIPVFIEGTLAKNLMKYCKEEDVIGVKGRIESDEKTIFIIAEKVTFLSSKKEDEKEN